MHWYNIIENYGLRIGEVLVIFGISLEYLYVHDVGVNKGWHILLYVVGVLFVTLGVICLGLYFLI